jgi:hypothetical protein
VLARRYTGNGWLDRLQKDAQKDELDASNTSGAFFVFLTVIQPPACVLVAWWFGIPFEYALVPIGTHLFMFFVSQYVLGTCK